MVIKKIEDFKLFKKSQMFIKDIYHITSSPKFCKDYGLKDQLQRASVSIILNFSEGFNSGSSKTFIQFLRYSYRSSAEVKTILLISKDIEYISLEQFSDLDNRIEEIQKMLSGLILYLIKNK